MAVHNVSRQRSARRPAAWQGWVASHSRAVGSAVGSGLVVLGLALVGLVILPGTGLAQTTPDTGQAQDAPKPLGSLKKVPLQTPPNLSDFVQDKTAAVALGKAFFWDQQMGSDGVTACATCHYQAGADVRTKNVISPGVNGGSTDVFGKGPTTSSA